MVRLCWSDLWSDPSAYPFRLFWLPDCNPCAPKQSMHASQDEAAAADSASLADRHPAFLKDRGDALMRAGNAAAAINAYTRALELAGCPTEGRQGTGALTLPAAGPCQYQRTLQHWRVIACLHLDLTRLHTAVLQLHATQPLKCGWAVHPVCRAGSDAEPCADPGILSACLANRAAANFLAGHCRLAPGVLESTSWAALLSEHCVAFACQDENT
jgi:hypothetical protein